MTGTVEIPLELQDRMRQHATSTYPEECCGFLIGDERDAVRTVRRVEPAPNGVGSERERRYLIPPAELRALESELDGSGSQVMGFYHSHPDHPARPSQFDRDHAWPWYIYVVLGVTQDGADPVGAFELGADSQEFFEVPISSGDGRTRGAPNGGVSESS